MSISPPRPKNTPPLDMIAIQRHILAQMDIRFWVGKSVYTERYTPSNYTRQRLPQPIDLPQKNTITQTTIQNVIEQSKSGNDIQPKINDNNKNTASLSQVIAQLQIKKTALDKQASNDNSNSDKLNNGLNADNLTTDELIDNKTIDNKPIDTKPLKKMMQLPPFFESICVSTDHFALLGVRYGDWVLVADRAFLTIATEGIWTALVNALKKQNPNTIESKIHYPLVANDYPQYQNYHQGAMVLLGFLIRLCYDMQSVPLKVGCLTPISQAIDFGANFWEQVTTPPIPSLDEMSQNPQAKHTLWQQLND